MRIAVHHAQLADTAEPPEWVHLLPAGAFGGVDGRGPWRVDDPAAVVAASSTPLLLDENHATEHRAGQPNRAAGWIEELQARSDGIWGRVQWTAHGQALVKGRSYRHLSPVFGHDKGGRVVRLLRAGLVNDPNLHLIAINRETMMSDLEQVATALGLPKDSSAEAIATHAAQVTAQSRQALDKIAEAVGAEKGADVETIVAAAAKKPGTAQPDPAEYVAVNEFRRVADQLAGLQKSVNEREAKAEVDALIKDGRLQPALRGWAVNYRQENPEGFKSYAETLPKVVGGQSRTAGPPPKGGEELSDAELAVCSQMGLDPAKYAEARKAERAAMGETAVEDAR